MAPTYWNPEWVEFAKTMSTPPTIPEGENEEKRQMVNHVLEHLPKLLPPPPDDVTTKELTISNGPAIRIYTPSNPFESQACPLIVFAHGGGWFAGNLDTEDRSCRILCSRASAIIVSVDYRCDYTVPLQDMVDDLHAAFLWSRENATSLGADANQTILWGGSAGGHLVIALTYRLVREGRGGELAGLLCMNSIALHPESTPGPYKHLMRSYEENDGPLPFVAGKDTLRLYEYRELEPPSADEALFPVTGGPEALRGFPRTWVITSGNDASRDDGTVLEAVLRDAGVSVKRENVDGLAHYFWVFNLPKANERFWDSMTGAVKWVLEQ